MGWLGLLFLLPVALLVVALRQVITSRPQSLSDKLANDLAASETGGGHLGLNGVSSAVFNVEPNSDSQLITGINWRATAFRVFVVSGHAAGGEIKRTMCTLCKHLPWFFPLKVNST